MPLDFAVSFLDELFVDLKRELTRADQTFFLFSTSPEALGSVLDKEKMLLTRLLEAKKSEMSAIFDALTELFLVHAVPFSAMTWNIDNIRAKLIHSMAHDGGSERVFILAVNDLFEELKNYISKAYVGKRPRDGDRRGALCRQVVAGGTSQLCGERHRRDTR